MNLYEIQYTHQEPNTPKKIFALAKSMNDITKDPEPNIKGEIISIKIISQRFTGFNTTYYYEQPQNHENHT